MHARFVGKVAGVVDQELGGEVVDPVDNHVVLGENLQRVAGCQPLFVH